MFTGADKTNATSSATSTTQPYSAYRFNAMRWDGTSGQYDMGFRNYDPGLNQFTSRDMYNGATQNMGLTTDPFTGGAYAFGNGNPVSNIEQDGHAACTGSQALINVINSCGVGPGAASSPAASSGGGSSGLTQQQQNATIAAASGIIPALNAGARGAMTQKLDNASNLANNLALGTSWIPLVDEGTSIAAGFFQGWKGANAIQNGNTAGGIGDLGLSLLDIAGGEILGSLAGKGPTAARAAVDDSASAAAQGRKAAQALGAAREAYVAKLTGGTVATDENGVGMLVTRPNVGKTDVDVIGPNGEYIAVGAPAKALSPSQFGKSLSILKWAAQQEGVPAQYYFEEGTPQTAINQATKALGADNVFTFSMG
jgi:RHS repeat-associated protein